MGRRALSGKIVALMAALAGLAAVPAAADPVSGATYTATAGDGAKVTFTVSSDGTMVQSYEISGTASNGCQFMSEGQPSGWSGAPINHNKFDWENGNAVSFKGTFDGAQTASGTFDVANPDPSANCNSGTVNWKASTSASGSGGNGGSGGGSGGGKGGSGGGSGGSGGGGGKGGHGAHRYATRVVLRKHSSTRLSGRLATVAGCRAGRIVVLWHGKHRVGRVTSDGSGRFAFTASSKFRGRALRASVLARSISSGLCSAGSSKFLIA